MIIIIMEIYAAPKLSKYMTALGTYVKSFTYETTQHAHAHTHTHTTHTYMRTCTHKHIVRNS